MIGKGIEMDFEFNHKKDYGNTYTVYMHICPNGKRYIGMTRQEVMKRWHGGSGYKNQKTFYNDIKRFGWKNIEHNIVGENLDLNAAIRLEQGLIKQYNTQNPEFGYNIKNGGQTFGEHSEEFLNNLRERMKGNTYNVGRKLSKDHINALNAGREKISYKREKGLFHHSKSTKMKLSNNAKQRWEDADYRQRMIENHAKMSGKCNPMFGRRHTAETKKIISEKAKGRTVSEETKIKMSEHSSTKRMVAQFDLNGNKIAEFSSCKEAAKKIGGNSTNISFACRNQGRTYYGYKWRYIDDNT